MPYELRTTPKGFGIFNFDRKIWKSYNTTKPKAKAQLKLLNSIEFKKIRRY